MAQAALAAADNTSRGQIAVIPPQERSIVRDLAHSYGMEQAAFQAVVMATCFPPKKDENPPSQAEFAAFLLVAKEHGLNPVLREIYGFRAQSGAIVPIVPIDGWCNIINRHPQTDGIRFKDHLDDKGKLVAITAIISRKDRKEPVEVTEYMVECKRETTPWNKFPARMLRHKALIQCARYAFSLGGIYDPDEGERMIDVTPPQDQIASQPAENPDPFAPAAAEEEVAEATTVETATVEGPQVPLDGDIISKDGVVLSAKPTEEDLGGIPTFLDRTKETKVEAELPLVPHQPEAILKWIDERCAKVFEIGGLEMLWDHVIEPQAMSKLEFPPDVDAAQGIRRKHEKRLGAD